MCKGKSKEVKDFFLTNKWGALIVGGVSGAFVSILSKVLDCSGLEIFLSGVVSFLLPEVVIHNLCEESIIRKHIDEYEKNINIRLTEHEKSTSEFLTEHEKNTYEHLMEYEDNGRGQLDECKTTIEECKTTIEEYTSIREQNAETHICTLIDYLAEECFKNCSEYDLCRRCNRFKDSPEKCNGLLRAFLYEDCKNLIKSIDICDKGYYQLTTNIESYHEIAIKYMLAQNSTLYGVIQTIDDVTNDNAQYDYLDFHYLKCLLKLVQQIEPNTNKKYYEKNNFKIKWLLVGDVSKIKNNYDYIFYVIGELGKDLSKNVADFFEFYNISKSSYQMQRQGKSMLDGFVHESNPSLGVFGKHFIFVDALQRNGTHGCIYTTKESRIKNVISFYNELLNDSKKIDFSVLLNEYNRLISNEPEHKNTLEDRWLNNHIY